MLGPKLEELHVLFSADSRPNATMLRRSFLYAVLGDGPLEKKYPLLRSLALSNLDADGPIYSGSLPA